MFSWLVKEMAEKHGITEQLNATAPLTWGGEMNNIRNAAIEVITKRLYLHKTLIASGRFGLRLFS